MERLGMPRDRSENDGDLRKFWPAMMLMPGESRKRLWKANLESVKKAQNLLKEVECPEKLITLLRSQTSQVFELYKEANPKPAIEVERGFYVGKRTAKIMVVSLLTVLIELSPSDGGSADHSQNKNTVIQGCEDAWKIMELVEKKDPGAALVNKEADLLFSSITKNTKKPRWLGLTLPTTNNVPKTVQDAKECVTNLVEQGKKKIGRSNSNDGYDSEGEEKISSSSIKDGYDSEGEKKISSSSNDGYDSVNWTALFAIHYLKIVSESIHNCSVDNMQDLLGAIQSSLAYEIRNCVMRVKERIIDECRLDADADMEEEEEKLWNVLEVAGMAKSITKELFVESTGAASHGPLTEAEQTV